MDTFNQMLSKFSITTILLFVISGQLFSQSTIVGNWKRVMPTTKHNDSMTKQMNYGNLEIREDSTFRILGDSTNFEIPIPGWHISDGYSGSWTLTQDGNLFLSINPKDEKLTLAYKIIKLNRKELVIRSRLAKNHKNNIKYRRL